MKFIILTNDVNEKIYVNSIKILHIRRESSMTWVSIDGELERVHETPEEIIDLINNRGTIPIRRQDLINDQVYFKEDISLGLDEDLRKKSIQSHNPNRRRHE